jgi:hypothetical protein
MKMAKAKKSVQSQAARIMEAKKKAGANQGGQKFAQAMGKTTLAKQGRKATRMG